RRKAWKGSSDPTSPRREASLFNLPGRKARQFSFQHLLGPALALATFAPSPGAWALTGRSARLVSRFAPPVARIRPDSLSVRPPTRESPARQRAPPTLRPGARTATSRVPQRVGSAGAQLGSTARPAAEASPLNGPAPAALTGPLRWSGGRTGVSRG